MTAQHQQLQGVVAAAGGRFGRGHGHRIRRVAGRVPLLPLRPRPIAAPGIDESTRRDPDHPCARIVGTSRTRPTPPLRWR
ncbi:MAG TPA: hypothetical protein VK059_05550, partial [Nocardioidaceae bacterium]|nr:hypothetical protein [Nocardioidaceae bacterium]